MKKDSVLSGFLAVTIFFVGLGPFLYISRYAFWSTDDFCRVHSTWGTLWKNFLNWYTNHNGRYTNAILSHLPVYDYPFYQLASGLSILLFGTSLFLLLNSLFRYFKMQIKTRELLLVSLFIYLLIIGQLPSIAEFFYWYAGMTSYLISLTIFNLMLFLLIDFEKGKRRFWIYSGLLIILGNGNNEILMVIINFLIFSFLVFESRKKGKIDIKILLLNFVSWISSLFVILSPGSRERREHYPEGGDFLYSLKYGILHAGRVAIENILEVSFLLFFLGLFCLSTYYLKRTYRSNCVFINPVLLLGLSFAIFTIPFFVLIYSQGVFLSLGRTNNFIVVLFYLLTTINILNFAAFLNTEIPYKRHLLYFAWIFLFMGGIISSGSNYSRAIADLASGKSEVYFERQQNRLQQLKTAPSIVVLDTIQGPGTIWTEEIPRDPNTWQHECFKLMVIENYNKDIRSIKMEY